MQSPDVDATHAHCCDCALQVPAWAAYVTCPRCGSLGGTGVYRVGRDGVTVSRIIASNGCIFKLFCSYIPRMSRGSALALAISGIYALLCTVCTCFADNTRVSCKRS